MREESHCWFVLPLPIGVLFFLSLLYHNLFAIDDIQALSGVIHTLPLQVVEETVLGPLFLKILLQNSSLQSYKKYS